MSVGADSPVAGIEQCLRAVASPERAEHEKRYLKSDLAFLGATVWQIQAVVKEFAAEPRDLDHDDLIGLVNALWPPPTLSG